MNSRYQHSVSFLVSYAHFFTTAQRTTDHNYCKKKMSSVKSVTEFAHAHATFNCFN